MNVAELLLELYSRVPPLARQAVEGLDAAGLRARPRPEANPVGWLVWHLTRVQDHHISQVAGRQQVWLEAGRAAGFGLTADPEDHGYGHTPEQVAAVRPSGPDVLLQYLDAVDGRTQEFLRGVSTADLDRVVDDSYDPPVTLGVRLVSVADDCLQHVGQAAYGCGLLTGGSGA